jgi:serine phosphatase RsbU (regulator of sigma subunit)
MENAPGAATGLVPLDICLISAEPDGLSALEGFLRIRGCRPIVTTPARPPAPEDWDAFDLVVLDWSAGRALPDVPAPATSRLVATCSPAEIDDAPVLRAALRAGARDVLPRDPGDPAWTRVLASARRQAPGAGLRYLDPIAQLERFVRLERETFSIGRDPQNDVVLPQPFVSRLHARIERRGGRYRLVDLGSRSGTTVNERPIQEHYLGEGDRIQIGGPQGPTMTFSSATMTDGTIALEPLGLLEKHAVNREVHDIASILESLLSLDTDLVLGDVLEIVLDRMVEFVDADRGVVFLRPWSRGVPGKLSVETLELGAVRGRGGARLDRSAGAVEPEILAEVLRLGRGAARERPLAGDAASPDDTQAAAVRSSLCVPLKVRGKLLPQELGPTIIGVLYLDTVSRRSPFSPFTLRTLEVLAAEAAIAIHSTYLYEETLERRRVKEEMEIAREIQRDIFGEIRGDRGRWQLCGSTLPSQEVGGDFLSTVALDGGRLFVVVGDVSGKGVPAALFSTMLEGLFFGLSCGLSGRPDLALAASRLNAFVLEKSRLKKFATAIFGVLEEDGAFHYINTGHNPGLVARRSGAVEELSASGTVLGMFDDASYQPSTIRMETGDFLVLYSDGITDSRNRDDKLYSINRLRDWVLASVSTAAAADLSAVEVHDGILADFKTFLRSAPPMDDVTLLAVKRR